MRWKRSIWKFRRPNPNRFQHAAVARGATPATNFRLAIPPVPAKEIKVLDKVLEKLAAPALPPPPKKNHSETAASAPKKSADPVPPPVREPVGEISEARIVNELPTLDQPGPKPETETNAPSPSPPASPARTIQPMFVVMLSPEMAPVAKVGGLGDVVFGLSRELELRGNAVEVILPKYDCMRYHHIQGLKKAYERLRVPWFGGTIETTVWFGFVHGRKCFFIDPHSPEKFFNRGIFYGHADDVMRFAFFCRAAMEFLYKTGKQPDIIHCHDWQTALAPVLLWEMYQQLGMRHPRVCFTIHNFKHQGLTGEHVLRATGLNRPEYFFHNDRLRDNHNPYALNLMKAGIVYSNFVTTVSPRHAWETKDAGQAFGLEPTLHTHHLKYGGVLNGLDYDMFNPEKDPYIPSHFNARTVENKYENKRALRKRLWLADNAKPIIAFIGRLDPQKGPELVRHAIFYALNHGAQFVLLGESPDKSINEHFWGLKRHLNDNPDCHLEIGYSDELAHLIYAGADMMVVPSHFEPCGLTQLISLRYGTVPIVRAVGGLADTVFDKDHSPLPLHQRNGYVFPDASDASMESALYRAIGCYYQFPDHFRHLMVNGMNSDYSWNHPGQHYLNIYDYIREK
jgi:starch synthase